MGKSMQDLLNEFNFEDKKFNPRSVTKDMLSSKETAQKTQPIKILGLEIEGVTLPYDRQYTRLTQDVRTIYGLDAPRILLRGTVDTNKITKKVVNRAARIAGGLFGNASGVGTFVRNSISSLVSVKQPSDTISGNNTENGLYASMNNGSVNNSKNPITSLLSQYRTPSQFKEAIGDIKNGEVKIGGAVVDQLTNSAFKGLGWVASKIGIGKQDSGKSNSLKNSLESFTDSQSVSRFPSTFAVNAAKLNKQEKPTGVVVGQEQFIRSGDYPNMYDDLKTNIQIDGINFNPKTYSFTGNKTNDYLTRNPIEDFKKSGIFSPYGNGDTIDAESGDRLKTSGSLGFNTNNETFGPRSQTFYAGLGINDGYNLKDANLTGMKNNLGGFLIVKDGDKGVYKISDIVKAGQPTRFSDKATDSVFGMFPNVQFFGGYKNRKQEKIKGDHRLKSLGALRNNESDLITMRFKEKGSSNFIYLLSNITGFTDTPTPTWGEAKAVGSPYKFYFYESFEREVSFKTQIYASSQEELSLVWLKANEIMKLTNGTSGGVEGIKGKVCSLRIGDMFDSNSGFITSCTLNVPDISPWEIKDGSQYPFVCELDITYKVIQTVSDSNFYGPYAMKIKSPNYTYLDFPEKAPLPPPNNFDEIPRPAMPAIDIKRVGVLNPLNSPTRQLLKANLAASNVEDDLTQTTNAEKYLADTANITPPTSLLPNTATTSNVSNTTTSTPQNFGKQPEYDPKTGDYKRNIFGKIKMFKTRGVDNNQN